MSKFILILSQVKSLNKAGLVFKTVFSFASYTCIHSAYTDTFNDFVY